MLTRNVPTGNPSSNGFKKLTLTVRNPLFSHDSNIGLNNTLIQQSDNTSRGDINYLTVKFLLSYM